jgi:hypothetical protein
MYQQESAGYPPLADRAVDNRQALRVAFPKKQGFSTGQTGLSTVSGHLSTEKTFVPLGQKRCRCEQPGIFVDILKIWSIFMGLVSGMLSQVHRQFHAISMRSALVSLL